MSASGSLIALRTSGACFGGPYDVKSTTFEELLQKYDELEETSRSLREELLRDLAAAVPNATNPRLRAWLLSTQRDLFNQRWTKLSAREDVSASLSRKLADYIELSHSQEVLFDDCRSKTFTELRAKLSTLVADPLYEAAVDYSCPWLLTRSRKVPTYNATEFSKEERGLYSYAVKFFSKANPFHIFAGIVFPPSSAMRGASGCEVVVNSAYIAVLERELLRGADVPHRRLLYLSSFTADPYHIQFVTTFENGIRCVEVRNCRFIHELCCYFRSGRIAHSVSSCVEHLAVVLSQPKEYIAEQLSALLQAGVMVQYIVRDFNNFGPDLTGIDPSYDETIRHLQHLHLGFVNKLRVGPILNGIRKLKISRLPSEENIAFINTYDTGDTSREEEFAARCVRDLITIKPFFSLRHNFSEHVAVIRDYLLDCCARAPDRSLSYLRVLREFVKNSVEIVTYWRSAGTCFQRLRVLDSWIRSLGRCQTDLTSARIQALLSECPEKPQDVSLCFCGPADRIDNRFFPSNVFAGNGRYLSRYLVGQGRYRQPQQWSDACLDVQLMVPSGLNRMHIAPQYSVGCSFDKRFSHLFEMWIDPADIVIERLGDELIYRHKSTGSVLRFHFCGFRLAESLPAQYQLLLCSHADAYHNPFLPQADNVNRIYHDGPLWYGMICLRREAWSTTPGIFKNVLSESDILKATLKCRDLLRDVSCITNDHWYFRVFDGEGHASKPRFLDVTNPLSVCVFRREVKRRTCASVAFSPMAPSVSHLQTDSEGHTVELMIEV